MLTAALSYAVAGWAVVPLHAPLENGGCTCSDADCRQPGKHPRTRHGLTDASCDPDRIAAWWRRWPDANVGVRTGEVVVLDIDGSVGTRSLRELEAANAPLPATRTSLSARGLHLYFHTGPHMIPCSAGRLGRGLDVRGHGGYIVAPPSRHASGPIYTWIDTSDLAPLPTWLAGGLIPPTTGTERGPLPDAVVSGPDERARRYLQAATDGELLEVGRAQVGTRNETLNRASFRLGQLTGAGLGDRDQLASALLGAAMSAGLGERQARATIASGLHAGERSPRPLPPKVSENP